MRYRLTFFDTLRLIWVGVNIAILIASVSGFRDLSGIILMLSFPASVVAGLMLLIAFDATGWDATWVFTLFAGIVTIVSGYFQWFVIGRAVADRIVARLPARPFSRATLRAAVMFAFLGEGAIGVEMVRAQDQAKLFVDRAMTVRDGMSVEEVKAILGHPKQVFGRTATTASPSVCSGRAVRGESYWYEHDSLPRRLARDSFFVMVCSDQHGKVVEVATGWAH